MLNTTIFAFSFFILICMFFRANSQNQGHQTDSKKIRLYHYPNSINASERYDLDDSLQNGKLRRNRKTKIIVHGAGGHCFKDDVPYRIVEAYLRAKASGREDYNVLCLDYGPLAQLSLGLVPGETVPSVRKRYEYICDIVSEKAVRLILELQQSGYVSSFDQIHIIGHSLGGHVSGFIGRKIQEQTRKSIGRITGLDIANIFLVYNNEINLRNQLDLSDAKFVDIIHTSNTIGLKGNFGHCGLQQQSCFTKGPISNVTELILGGCSHVIVGKYWENSIDYPNITACKDESWESFKAKRFQVCPPENSILFGEYVSTDARGKYFLEYPLIKP